LEISKAAWRVLIQAENLAESMADYLELQTVEYLGLDWAVSSENISVETLGSMKVENSGSNSVETMELVKDSTMAD
jgi:hypothetical protein